LPASRTICDACLPDHKRESLDAAIASASETLARLRADGRDPSHGGEVGRKRGATNARHYREAQAFERKAGDAMPYLETWSRDIFPRLAAVSVRSTAKATNLSTGYCSSIKKGLRVPHAVHWQKFGELVGR
jgi:hypothetical protein